MRAPVALLLGVVLIGTSCSRREESASTLNPTAFGAAIVESSGGKQFAQTGALLPQPA